MIKISALEEDSISTHYAYLQLVITLTQYSVERRFNEQKGLKSQSL